MLKQVMEIHELLDSPRAGGGEVGDLIRKRGADEVTVRRIEGARGATDFIKVRIKGSAGGAKSAQVPTVGIIGRLGGIGARPERVGLVSDADGAVAALSCALKLADMASAGDRLHGDVIICTHICPDAPTQPHDPVPFMGSPVDMAIMNEQEVDPAMSVILSIDATKGNRVLNRRGFAISPTVKEGYILRVSEDLLDIMTWSTGLAPVVLPITMQDITPYGNGLFHVNSILQPCTATSAPVVGVAITAETAVPGCGTGASRETDIEEAARFCLEVAKAVGDGSCRFHDDQEFQRIVSLYGPMHHLQTPGRTAS
ncbi:MAG: DUF1177 domain-containing protein [Spirochaetaceae bacterium]|nr:MAG: DUF1177 domain-containing protein [Spirochaetaceae bacterium]